MRFINLAIVTLPLLVSSLFQVSLTGTPSYLYKREPVPHEFHLGDRYPDRNESDQCRPIRLRITRNSRLYTSDLVTNTDPDIVFHSADARIMTSRLQTKLNSLAKQFFRLYSIKINVLRAWGEYSSNDSNPDSLHYEGLHNIISLIEMILWYNFNVHSIKLTQLSGC